MAIKSISFKDKYQDQYDFLMKQDNPSQFVCELIKNYMETENDFESKVEAVIVNYINNNFNIISNISNNKHQVNIDIQDIEDPW